MTSTVQEGQIPDDLLKSIETQIRACYQQHMGSATTLKFAWISLPPTQAYAAGKPSTASSLMVPVPDGTSSTARHALMSAISTIWMAATGCSEDELVLSMPDQSFADQFMRLQRSRLAGPGRLRALVRVGWQLRVSKFCRGLSMVSINLSRAA